jgi:hypothetical protein
MLSYCSTIARRAVFQGTRCASRSSVNNVALRRYGASGWRGMPIKLIDVSCFVRMDLVCICMDDGVVHWGVCVVYFEVLWRLRRFCFCTVGREWIPFLCNWNYYPTMHWKWTRGKGISWGLVILVSWTTGEVFESKSSFKPSFQDFRDGAQDTTQQMVAAHWLMACAIPIKDNLQSFLVHESWLQWMDLVEGKKHWYEGEPATILETDEILFYERNVRGQ